VGGRAGLADESLPVGDRNRFGTAVDAKLREHALNMACDRLRTDHELSRNLLGPHAPGEQLQDLALAARQLGVDRATRQRGRAPSPGAGDQPPGARKQLVGIGRLDDVVIATQKQACRAVERLRSVSGDEDDRKVIAELVSELAGDLEAAYVRKEDIEQNEGRTHPPRGHHGFFTGRCLLDRKACALEETRCEGPEIFILVDDQNGATIGDHRPLLPNVYPLKRSVGLSNPFVESACIFLSSRLPRSIA
jgi:hypothetical protein